MAIAVAVEPSAYRDLAQVLDGLERGSRLRRVLVGLEPLGRLCVRLQMKLRALERQLFLRRLSRGVTGEDHHDQRPNETGTLHTWFSFR